ncbi:hypothetical protein TW65_04885 [Stemphylium lycopersici]|nr:hypothetical protein TW65_04885 [Stemphylium lycopersici]
MSDQPATKRQKHVTTACLNCRKRKIKCDASTPSCSNCMLYTQECVYRHGLDKRKIPMKDRLAAAEAYSSELETLLVANGIALPGQEQEMLPTVPSPAHLRSELSTTGICGYPDQTAISEHKEIPGSSTVDTCPSLIEGSSPLVDQITGSLGSLQLAEDGQLRFYGATSNLHILTKETRVSAQRHGLTQPNEVDDILRAAGVGHFVDPELEEHLIKLYFCWEDPSIHFVEQDVFYRERKRCKANFGTSKLYSEVLVNAMCAVGASFTSRHCIELPEPLVDFFASRSRALLDIELDSPTISTVQSLGILSGVESIRKLDARGWLYSGMAVRLATDLGLHLDSQFYVDAGIIGEEEASLRKVVFWGVFIHERMWSLYLGRPVSLNENAITIPRYVARQTNTRYWQPYTDEEDDTVFPPLLDPIEELHSFNASLCAKMARVRDTLYSDSPLASSSPRQLHDFASDMRSELLDWHVALPEALRVDLSSIVAFYVPHVLQLHMQYHTLMILVNRPFFAENTPSIPNITLSDPRIGRPTCTESARAISRLLQIYRRLFNFRRINIQAVHLIFTASLIHALNACQATTDPSLRNYAWNDLETCQQALSEMSTGFQSAARALQVVNGIKSELLTATRKGVKRSAYFGATMNEGELSKKRQRPDGSQRSVSTFTESVDTAQDQPILDPSLNLVDSIFWSEMMSLDFPRF